MASLGAGRVASGNEIMISILLIERDADQPYFAAWLENTELMEPVAR